MQIVKDKTVEPPTQLHVGGNGFLSPVEGFFLSQYFVLFFHISIIVGAIIIISDVSSRYGTQLCLHTRI